MKSIHIHVLHIDFLIETCPKKTATKTSFRPTISKLINACAFRIRMRQSCEQDGTLTYSICRIPWLISYKYPIYIHCFCCSESSYTWRERPLLRLLDLTTLVLSYWRERICLVDIARELDWRVAPKPATESFPACVLCCACMSVHMYVCVCVYVYIYIYGYIYIYIYMAIYIYI